MILLRLFDIIFSLVGLIFLSPVLLVLFIIGLFDTSSPLFFQQRVGRGQKLFTLVKYRTMSLGTDSVATHLVDGSMVTKFGVILRKTKLDELPQLWNVLMGEMSLVGPRPCLPNQKELIEARKVLMVYTFRPGITGLAQIQGVDMSTPKKLAAMDAEMMSELSLTNYFSYIFSTVLGKGGGDKVKS